MGKQRKEFDVLNLVDVTDYVSVRNEVMSLFSIYPKYDFTKLHTAFDDFHRLFNGHYPGFHFCDTAYHDIQHTLDMSLAMARLIVGHDKQALPKDRLGPNRAEIGIICALFHDSGYIRESHDQEHSNGAEYTKTHVARSASFLASYLPTLGLSEQVFITGKLVHFTGYELSLERIKLENKKDELLGFMLGTSDLIAQMSDRCYLEKCRDRLYPEFVLGGIDKEIDPHGMPQYTFTSGKDLLFKTPNFYYSTVLSRLNNSFQEVYQYAELFFGHKNYYMEEIEKNINYLKHVLAEGDFSLLRRKPKENLATLHQISPYIKAM